MLPTIALCSCLLVGDTHKITIESIRGPEIITESDKSPTFREEAIILKVEPPVKQGESLKFLFKLQLSGAYTIDYHTCRKAGKGGAYIDIHNIYMATEGDFDLLQADQLFDHVLLTITRYPERGSDKIPLDLYFKIR